MKILSLEFENLNSLKGRWSSISLSNLLPIQAYLPSPVQQVRVKPQYSTLYV